MALVTTQNDRPHMRKVLFVCTANLQRSPTAENLFEGWKSEWVAKSAGIAPDPGRRPLTQELVDWADVIIVMEAAHGGFIYEHFRSGSDKTCVLNIPDRYFRNDPELISELMRRVPPVLERYKATDSRRKGGATAAKGRPI